MNKIALNITILFIIFLSCLNLLSQGVTLDNTGGKISNSGTIRIKSGQVKSLPDTIGGRFEFLGKESASQQEIPNIVYNQLVLKNGSLKIIYNYKNSNSDVKNLVVLDSLIISDNSVVTTGYPLVNANDVLAEASVSNTARYDGPKDIIMTNEVAAQDLIGNGRFSNLNVDNPFGVNVKGGGFQVGEKLTLTRGALRNDNANNFTMVDSSKIVRHAGASLAYEPIFDKRVDVRYVGSGNIVSGPELPTDVAILDTLSVENDSGLTLSRNVTVNESLYVGSTIFTEPDTLNKNILNYNGTANPVFGSNDAEISGSFRRTYIPAADTIIYNNPYTYAYFTDEASKNGSVALTVRSVPRTFAPHPDGDLKVKRYFQLKPEDINGAAIQDGVLMTFGYGWRNTPADPVKDETNNLDIPSIILERFLNGNWSDFTQSIAPTVDLTTGWAYGSASGITPFGDFAMGLIGLYRMQLAATARLEGAYRFGSMATDLLAAGLLPKTPIDDYPYNLDPQRATYAVTTVPDSTVDWVVLEFRTQLAPGGQSHFRTGLLKSDGRIVDLDGKSPIMLTNKGVDSGYYYIAVRHRNHLTVVTKDPWNIHPMSTPVSIDFTNDSLLMGDENALKLIAVKPDGTKIWGMVAGDVNNDGIIDENDYNLVWQNFDLEGYVKWDNSLSGIVNTRDLNLSWNNRDRASLLIP
jgi:hypothetical protein